MKNIKTTLVAMLALCGLSACGGNNNSQPSTQPSAPTSDSTSNSSETSTPQFTGDWDVEMKANMRLYLGEVLPYFELGTDAEYGFDSDDYGDYFYAWDYDTKDLTDSVIAVFEAAGFEYDYSYDDGTEEYIKEVSDGVLYLNVGYYSSDEDCGNEVYVWLEADSGYDTPVDGDWDEGTKLYMELFFGEILPYFELGEDFDYGFDMDDNIGMYFYAWDFDTLDYSSVAEEAFLAAGFEYYGEDEYGTVYYTKENSYDELLVVELGYYVYESGDCGTEVYVYIEGNGGEDYPDYSNKTDWTDEEKADMLATWGFEIPFIQLGEDPYYYFEDGNLIAYDYDRTDRTEDIIAIFENLGFVYDGDDEEGYSYYVKELEDVIIEVSIAFFDDEDYFGNEVYGYLLTNDTDADGEFSFTSKIPTEESKDRVVFESGNSVIVLEKGSNTSTPANNGMPATYGELRVYGGHKLTFSVLEGSIDTITINYSSVSGDKFKLEESIVTGGTVSYGAGEIVITANSNTSEVSMQMGGTAGHIRITSVVITTK